MSMHHEAVAQTFQPLLRNHQVESAALHPSFTQLDAVDPVGELRRQAQAVERSVAIGFGEEGVPHEIRQRAEKLGINPEIIVGVEMTRLGEVGWLIAVQEQTSTHSYELYAKMRIEEGYLDGTGFEWPGRAWVLPLQIIDNGQEIVIPPNVKALGYEILINTQGAASGETIVGMDSICHTGMFHGGHMASAGVDTLGCDCLGQLDQRRGYIAEHGGIEIIGIGEEGRGNGMDAHTGQIHSQSLAAATGERVPDTYDIVRAMGYPEDSRPPFNFMYPLMVRGIFGINGPVVIPTNNHNKADPFAEFGIPTSTIQVVDPRNPAYYDGPNAEAKRTSGGHDMPTATTHADGILTLRSRDPFHADGLHTEHNPITELDPQWNRNARERAIARIQEAQQAGGLRMVVALDRDETITWTALKHTDALRSALTAYGYNPEDLPTFDYVIRMGGTDRAFEHIPEYSALINVHRASARFNTDVPLVDERIPQFLSTMEDHGFLPAICITAAPVEIADAVEREIDGALGAQIPTLGKPEYVHLTNTSSWKIRELQKLADETGGPIVIVDDSMSLGRAIAELNDPRIYCVTLTGTLTNEHTMAGDRARGLILSDWGHLSQTLEEVYTLSQQKLQ